ncbi:MAG TPA: histidine kinase dimerization/phospho-acceptor domain-containing protein [Anaeromyxobacter sp.]|nr:histidine kinase dimerization/phospho-acceptor domain-containing protein [Anaeromyxobacter sp.]
MAGPAGPDLFRIESPAAWSGGPPLGWVRLGTALAAIGYGLIGAFNLLARLPPFADRILELSVAGLAALGFLFVGRRTVLACALVLASMTAEALSSLYREPEFGNSAVLVLLALVVLSGVFLGKRAVATTTVAVLVALPLALFLAHEARPHLAFSQQDVSRLITFEAIAAALGLLTWLGIRTLARAVAAAEVRQKVERLAEVGRVAAEVSHEVNNPLSAARANITYLAEHVDLTTHERAEILAETAEALKRISTTIGELRPLTEQPGEAGQ